MTSVIAGALLMLAAALIGIGVKRIFCERLKIFEQFQQLTIYLEREVAHLKTPIITLLNSYVLEGKGRFCEIIKRYAEKLQYGYQSSNEIYLLTKTAYLSHADNLLIANFLFGLGKGDLQMEITNLQRFNGIFAEKTQQFKKELKQKGEMYYKLSVLVGIALMILVV